MDDIELGLLLGKRIPLLIKNAHYRLKRKYKGVPLWAFVGDMTSFGSTYSIMVCKMFGWNPEQDAGVKIEEIQKIGG